MLKSEEEGTTIYVHIFMTVGLVQRFPCVTIQAHVKMEKNIYIRLAHYSFGHGMMAFIFISHTD